MRFNKKNLFFIIFHEILTNKFIKIKNLIYCMRIFSNIIIDITKHKTINNKKNKSV